MLAIITANNDDASQVYVRKKIKKCVDEGIEVKHIEVGEDFIRTKEYDLDDGMLMETFKLEAHGYAYHLTDVILDCNTANDVKGILLQLPLHEDISDEDYFINLINPSKDVDCLTKTNQGAIMLGDNSYLPCTTQAVLDLIKSNTKQTKDECVHVVGRSTLVTKPLIVALINEGYTVRNWNSTHKDIDDCVADDLYRFTKVHFVSGAGVANLFDENWYAYIATTLFERIGIGSVSDKVLKENLYIYDIGMNRDSEGKLCGDVERGMDVAYQTPVPGGIGPLTVENVIKNYRKLCDVPVTK